MSLKEELVAFDMIVGDGFVANHFHIVDQQHGLTMGQK